MIWYFVVVTIGAALWIGSIHVAYPGQLGIIWAALLVDLLGQLLYVILIAVSEVVSPKLKALMDKWFEYWPAINIEHRTERTNAFVTLVFGYSVVACMYVY
jgi:low temperature requirement protein LtrA